MWLGHAATTAAAAAARGGKITLTHEADHRQPAGLEGADRRLQEGEPGRHDQGDATRRPTSSRPRCARSSARGNAPDLFVVWPGNGSAMSVKQLAPTRPARGPQRPGLDQERSPRARARCSASTARPTSARRAPRRSAPSTTRRSSRTRASTSRRRPSPSCSPRARRSRRRARSRIALGLQTPWVTQLIPYAIAPSTAFADDPNLAKDMQDGKKSFTNSGWDEVYKRYLELEKRGYFNPNPNGTTFEQQTEMVGNGKAAMAIQVTGDAARLSSTRPRTRTTSARSRSRRADKADELKIPAGISAGLGVSAQDARTWTRRRRSSTWLGAAGADGRVRQGRLRRSRSSPPATSSIRSSSRSSRS